MWRGQRRLLGVVVAVAVLVVGGLSWRAWFLEQQHVAAPPPARDPLPKVGPRKGFVGSAACRECHAEQHASWHGTFHRKMTQRATPETVLAPFAGQVLASRGRRYELSRQGDRFEINLVDPDWESGVLFVETDRATIDAQSEQHRVTRPIVMTTGSHHMQGYWIPGFRGNLLRQIPWYFHIAEQRWIPREDAFLEPPGSRRHFMIWNSNCLACHSTGGSPGMNTQTLEVRTEVAELGISCEACHGAGRRHVAHRRSAAAKKKVSAQADRAIAGPDPTIVNPARLDHRRASHVCGQCHSTFLPPDNQSYLANGYGYQPGDELSTTFEVVRFGEPLHRVMQVEGKSLYWDDGACRVGGREYLGMVGSKCFTRGTLSCLSCHSMHAAPADDQLIAGPTSDKACLQCHKEFRGDTLTAHTHHAATSSGSRCYNCHMPFTSYALLKGIRSHRIDSPRVVSMRLGGRPNACNLCHLDRSARWSSGHVETWYGHPAAELDEDEQEVAAGVLLMLQGTPVQRAVTSWHAGWGPARKASGTDWLVPHLAEQLDDSYSANRWVAWQALKSDPAYADLAFDFVAPRSQREPVWLRLRREWARGSASLDPDLARRTVLVPGQGLDRDRTEKLVLKRDYREEKVPE
ncbi:MAG: multiheme c-type cytochrome [Planctomycetaceae bacterium]|nr:multiheme c-type cytochrome [Planctomycetaceae bacterium]